MNNKPIRSPIIYVPESRGNLYVHFRTHSPKINLKQQHKSKPGVVQHNYFVDPPHYLKHEVTRPVIQMIREVFIPYRHVTQEIKPVVQEVKTVVSAKVPQTSAYKNYGERLPKQYGYTVATNHGQTKQYSSAQDYNEQSKPNNYDLSSIYGINPSSQQLTDYMPAKSYDNKDNRPVYKEQVVYGMTTDYQHNPEDNQEYRYEINRIVDKPLQYVTRPEQYREQTNDQSGDDKYYGVANEGNVDDKGNDDGDSYAPAYTLQEQPEMNNYVDQGYFTNSEKYWSYDSRYTNNGQADPGYTSDRGYNSDTGYASNGDYSDDTRNYSDDLATSDGSSVQSSSLLPMLQPYNHMPIAKQATLADLAQLMSSQSLQYNFEPLRITPAQITYT